MLNPRCSDRADSSGLIESVFLFSAGECDYDVVLLRLKWNHFDKAC